MRTGFDDSLSSILPHQVIGTKGCHKDLDYSGMQWKCDSAIACHHRNIVTKGCH